MESKIKRSGNIELLRIVSMLMIVGYHMIIHGVMKLNTNEMYMLFLNGTNINKFFSMMFTPGGYVGVGLFFAITGYFYINKTKINLKKVIEITSFYGIILTLVLFVLSFLKLFQFSGDIDDVIKNIIFSLFQPISGRMWSFITDYCVLLLIAPYLNKIITKLNLKYKLFFIVLLLIWSALGDMLSNPFGYLQRGILFYTMGAYIRIGLIKINNKKFSNIIIAIMLWMIYILILYSTIHLNLSNSNISKLLIKIFTLLNNGIIVPCIVFNLFILFLKIKVDNKMINIFASATFGVYLIHDSVLMRDIIWNNIFKISTLYVSDLFPIFGILVIITIFISCSILQIMFNNLFLPKIDSFVKKINSKIES